MLTRAPLHFFKGPFSAALFHSRFQHKAEYCDAERHLICILHLQQSPHFFQTRVNTNLLKGFILIVPEWCCHAAQLKAAAPEAKHASVAGGAAAPRLPPLPAG